MIVLQTDDLLVRADPAHGGEILDLINPRTGAQYLGRPPFAPLPPRAGELDEETWTDSYRGGWQTVAPERRQRMHRRRRSPRLPRCRVERRLERRSRRAAMPRRSSGQGHGLAAVEAARHRGWCPDGRDDLAGDRRAGPDDPASST